MKKIHWRPIKDAVLYWVSTDGRVRTFSARPGILRPATEKGYLRVNIAGRMKRIHRLVAIAFLKPKPGLDEVNHIKPDKSNNNHTNLEWTNHLGNMQHCDRLGLREFRSGENHGMAKLTNDQVLEIRSLYESGKYSYPMISRMYGISISTAQRTVTKQNWTKI